ncbi:MAG: gamma-glutamyltransferase, partial [Gammaproteobacteria bacterium]|nr:gamma-glutamyltransferase [Gammaproteobacteria bacterium]
TKVGVDILKQGGNAIDAAVAVGFALAVTYPQAGNLGGGGFMMIYLADQKKTVALDYREMAPAKAHQDMFLDENGNVDNKKARFSHLSSGVPGTVAGMIHALEKYGTMSLKEVIAPALNLADKGLLVSAHFNKSLKSASRRLSAVESTRKVFYPNDSSFSKNNPPEVGEIFKQKDLAWTLKQISTDGMKAFYLGDIARKIVDDSQNNGGIISMQDMASYKAMERLPVTGTYRGYQVISMPPPSSGGVHLIQMLNILEGWELSKYGFHTAKSINLIVESMKRAYSDRSIHLGDPDYFDVPIKTLTSKHYARELHQQISTRNYVPSSEINPGKLPVYESDQTTHYSVVDKFGNAVSNTYTINATFGNGRVAAGTGILMNNEMDDFSSKPGAPNMFGLIGGVANAIEAGKRPLSSMTPTIVLKNDNVFMVTGSPGGSRIITAVLQAILNVIDYDMNIAEATAAARFHHQWYPDSLLMEKGIELDVLNQLRSIGYSVIAPELQGNSYTPTGRKIGMVQSIVKRNNKLFGVADDRRQGSLALGY